jgi:hypothetical protein
VDGAIAPDMQPHRRQHAARAAETPNGASGNEQESGSCSSLKTRTF